MTPKVSSNKKKSYAISFAIHAMLLFLAMVFFAWKAPGPPAQFPEIGIPVVYSTDLQGKENESTSEESSSSSESQPNEDTQIDEPTTDEPITADNNTQPVDNTTIPDHTDNTSDNPATDNSTNNQSTQNTTDSQSSTSNSNDVGYNPNDPKGQGNDAVDGNKGDKEGKDIGGFDPSKIGSGDNGTNSLSSIPGWKWSKEPDAVKVPHDGTVRIKVTVDDLGNIIGVKILDSQYPLSVQEKIKEHIKRAKLQATAASDGLTHAEITWTFKGQ